MVAEGVHSIPERVTVVPFFTQYRFAGAYLFDVASSILQ